MRRIIVLIAGLVGVFASAPAVPLNVDFGAPGTYDVWAGDTLPLDYPKGAKRTTESKLTLELEAVTPATKVFVWNLGTGNVASRLYSEVKAGWKVLPADYKYIGLIAIRVEHGGKPVAAANVEVSTPKRKQSHLLDPSTKGELRFFVVEPGQLDVKVSYRSEGKEAAPLEQAFKVSLKRDKPEPVFTVAISAPVETVAVSSGKASEEVAKPEAPGNPVGRILAVLATLAVAGGVGYWLLQLAKKNPGVLESKLKDLGVTVPDPAEPDEPVAVANPIAAPCPPEKIVMDNAVGLPTGSSVPNQPRLTSDFGIRFDIGEGSHLVGRENAPILIEGESTISRRHAEVIRAGTEIKVIDLGSTNGTFVNGERVDGERLLAPGDVVQFGAARFRFEN